MNTSDTISSLLQKLSSLQIEDLIFEQQLAREGYQFYYAIDNHDIHKYCFPGDLEGDKFEMDSVTGKINYDLENDMVTAYDDFYENITRQSPIFFLYEYIPELKDMKFQIEQRVLHSRLFNYATDFNTYFEATTPDNSQIIIQDFTLFIAIATGFIQNGAQRFNSLMTSPYFIFRSDQFASIENGTLLRKAFENSYGNHDMKKTEKIFETFMEISPKGNRFSKRTDSEAMARVSMINNILLKEKSSAHKPLLLFLSTSGLTTKVSRNIIELLPRVNSRAFNFHRTVEQLFINRLLQDLDYEARHERLTRFKEVIQYWEQSGITIASKLSDWEKNIIESLRVLREKYVNTNLARKEQFLKIQELSNKLDEVKTNMNFSKLKMLYANLQKLSQQYASESQNINDIRIVETAFQIDQIFMATFKKAVNALETGNAIQIGRGKDVIAGTGQHLPIVFMYKSSSGNNIMDEIAELYLDQFAFLHNELPPESLTKRITDLAASIYGTETENPTLSLSDKLILCLYLLILPNANIDNRTNNDIVEEFLRALYLTGNKQADAVLYSDFLYILCWVLRRNAKYSDALKYIQEGLVKFPDDARFYHASFLLNVCLTPERLSNKARAANYTKFLSDINIAQEKYASMLENKSHTIAVNIVATLLNSEIYADTLLTEVSNASVTEKKKTLDKVRNEKLQRLKKITGSEYEKYPEFLHTEAYLEYIESEYTDDEETKRGKIDAAINILKTAIRLGDSLINYDTKDEKEFLAKLIGKQMSLKVN